MTLPQQDTRAEEPVTVGLRNSQHSPWYLLILLPILAALPGCGPDAYSESMVYPVRTDPVVTGVGGRELVEPDRPGQLPLLAVKDLQDSRNPFYEDKELKYIDTSKWQSESDKQELLDVLQDVFGTPANPKVDLITRETRQLLKLDEGTLHEGSRLYRLYCLQCHGLTGDGRGPTSKWVNPHPRDYRPGLFKFQSVKAEGDPRPPRRDDLYRTIHDGVEGTAMQSYNMLPEHELNAIVSYVIHLSIRGEVESEVFKGAWKEEKDKTFLDPKILARGSVVAFVRGNSSKPGGKVRDVIEKWRSSQQEESKIVPGPYSVTDATMKESVQNGYNIFTGRGAVVGGCMECHKDFGRRSLYKPDKWATLVRPRDLTKPVYRGGRRPIDMYYRIHSGINGSDMPPHSNILNSDQIWDVVNFIRALPYPEMRKHLVPPIE
ncbi:MAG TPA: c-type cytochrome [Gemmataceae bacterium]|nr:c-type cytochrome [Gemmataceae bacterium]